ncbi:hypothetical protein [Streptomyces venezuelae]|uniref:hypothetical protein n=1 Tax=Streptomyces venezuelae TaxID=54571 RepID=UPI00365D00C8
MTATTSVTSDNDGGAGETNASRRVVAAVLVNTIGTSTSTLVLPLVAFQRHGGMAGSLLFVGGALLGKLLGSVMAPRLKGIEGRAVFIRFSCVLAAVQVAYFLSVQAGAPGWTDVLVYLVFGCCSAILSVGQFQMIGGAVSNERMAGFYATLSSVVQAGSLIGAGAVAALGHVGGVRYALLLDAATYLLAAALLRGLVLAGSGASGQRSPSWAVVLPFLPLILLGSLPAIAVTILNASFPEMARVLADGRTEFIGYLDISYALGGLGMGFALSRWGGDRATLVWPLLSCVLSLGALTALVWQRAPVTALLAALFAVNAALTVLNVRVFAQLQRRSSHALKGRVASVTLIANLVIVTALGGLKQLVPDASLELYLGVLVGAAVLLAPLLPLDARRGAARPRTTKQVADA